MLEEVKQKEEKLKDLPKQEGKPGPQQVRVREKQEKMRQHRLQLKEMIDIRAKNLKKLREIQAKREKHEVPGLEETPKESEEIQKSEAGMLKHMQKVDEKFNESLLLETQPRIAFSSTEKCWEGR